ncbi:MAG: nucleotide exchange factor GrpE [Candidatus Vogelbacteria bacterium]|nr:nucleotide exchange factor GrpE [Candidatus Vogelbacteria bacterium]
MSNLNNKKSEDGSDKKCPSCKQDQNCNCGKDNSTIETNPTISLEDKLKACEVLKQEYLDGWQRAKADFVNARRDEEKLRLELVKYAKTDLIVELLRIVDNFDRAFANKETWEKVDKNWRIGVEYIYSELMNILQNNGVKEIGNIGDKFDSTIHESVGVRETEDTRQDDTVESITSKGFTLNGRIVRPAKVIIWHLKK